MGIKFSSVEVSFLTHATEDFEKTLATVSNTLGVAKEEFQCSSMKGHFENPIQLFKARLLGEAADKFVERLFSYMVSEDKMSLGLELEEYVDEHQALFLRIGKQPLFEGRLGLSQTDAIQVKLKPKFKTSYSAMLSTYRGLLE